MTAALAVCDRLAQHLRRLHKRLLERTPEGGLVLDQLSLEDCLRFNNALTRLEAALRSKLDELKNAACEDADADRIDKYVQRACNDKEPT